MPTLQGEKVVVEIKEHQTSAVTGWEYSDLVRELHAWVNRFDRDFELNLPTPVIAIASLRINVLGTYRLGRNEIGTRTTITFNGRWLPVRPFSDTLVTLIHELLHAFEEWHLGREVGGWYHTKVWRAKMEAVGILADEHGITVGVLPKFSDYLQRYGVPDVHFCVSGAYAPMKRRQMAKWICGCPCENPVRAARLHARCVDCQQLYRRVDS